MFAIALAGIVVAAPAAAQTTRPVSGTTTTSTDPTTGAYDKLSPGNRRIARALFEAQPAPKLTLDQIASMKQNGQGWGPVFKQMKTQGLVTEKNLGQVISTYNHQHRMSSGGPDRGTNAVSSGHGGGNGNSHSGGSGGGGAGHGRVK